jgi:hypothetical protein
LPTSSHAGLSRKKSPTLLFPLGDMLRELESTRLDDFMEPIAPVMPTTSRYVASLLRLSNLARARIEHDARSTTPAVVNRSASTLELELETRSAARQRASAPARQRARENGRSLALFAPRARPKYRVWAKIPSSSDEECG